MSYSSMPTRNLFDRLYELVDFSSNWPMEGEDDLAGYYECFLSLSEPLVFFCNLSKRECNKLFLQGFHPDDHATFFPYIINKHPNQLPGDFDFREVFNVAMTMLSHRRLAAKAKAMCRRKLVREEEDRELEYFIRGMHSLSIHDPRYAILYRQCTRRFLDVAEHLPKPEPLPKLEQEAPLQPMFHHNHALSVSSSLAHMPLPSVPEPTPPMDTVANTLAVPVDPSPESSPAPDLVSHAPPLPNDTPTSPLHSHLVAPSPHASEVKPDNHPIQECLEVLKIKLGNVPPAEEPKKPQSQKVQGQQ